MSKKRTGLLIAFGAVLGAAAAGLSYYLKYKSFSDELDRDFHDYEDDGLDENAKKEEAAALKETPRRSYISLWKAKTAEVKEAIEDFFDAEDDDDADKACDSETGCACETRNLCDSEWKEACGCTADKTSDNEAGSAAATDSATENDPSAKVTVEEDTNGTNA